jgi:hypothetical protein
MLEAVMYPLLSISSCAWKFHMFVHPKLVSKSSKNYKCAHVLWFLRLKLKFIFLLCFCFNPTVWPSLENYLLDYIIIEMAVLNMKKSSVPAFSYANNSLLIA